MKNVLLMVLVCLACACSSADVVEQIAEPAEQSQAATGYTAWSGTTTIPALPTTFCHPTYFGASGGHSQSANWPGTNTPKNGASFGMEPPTLNAYQNANLPNWNVSGSALMQARCNTFAEFNFGATAAQSAHTPPSWYFAWGTSSGPGQQSTGYNGLWNYPASFCYLSGVTGLSTSSEVASVYVNGPTQSWGMGISGVPALGSSAHCVYPDRPWLYAAEADVGPNQTVDIGMIATAGECFITRITGSLDDGAAYLTIQGSRWKLVTAGTVQGAQAYCIKYAQ